MLHIVAVIHNNSLGRTIQVDTSASGLGIIREMAEMQLKRRLTNEELDLLKPNCEVYNDEDSENIFCWSLGIVEQQTRYQP